jgi:peptidoglycan/LPS O-acetylase OafA/YrhL
LKNPRFPLFDGLRGLAVLGILAFHSSELTGRIGFGLGGRFAETAGSSAVLLFFAISGFLLYRPYAAARLAGAPSPSTATYARRRALRILPAYWTILTLLAVYPGITGVFTGDWWRYYGYLQVYAQRTQGLGIPVAWTLCVEVSFYVTLPLWARITRRATGRQDLVALAALALAGAAVQCLSAARHIPYPLGVSLPGQCTWLALGMAVAVISVEHGDDARVAAISGRPELCWALSAGCMAGLIAMVPAGGLFGLIAAVARPAGSGTTLARIALEALLVAGLLTPAALQTGERRGVPGRLLASRPLAYLGTISYSFYLWHLTVTELLARGSDPAAFSASGWNVIGHVHTARTLVLFLLTLLLTGLIATASYRLIELPFLRRKA